jgi:hypothetical protein
MPSIRMDAIVVPGAGLLAGGGVPPWVENRLIRVLEIADGEVPVILLRAGTVHTPHPTDPDGRPMYESCAAASWLRSRGFPAHRLLVETASYDTVGNAYFLRVIHADPRGWRRLRIITSEFHLARLQAVFGWIFAATPADPPYQLEFESVPDVGMNSRALAARTGKEASSLAAVLPVIARIRTLAEIHRWLFTEHEAYAVAFQGRPRAALPADLLESY